MRQLVKKAWIKALRSKKYQQIQGQLKDECSDNGYCCLGVLTDLYIKSPTGKKEKAVWCNKTEGSKVDCANGSLPMRVLKWSRLKENNPLLPSKLGEDGSTVSAIECNDDLGLSFTEIAKLIEKDL